MQIRQSRLTVFFIYTLVMCVVLSGCIPPTSEVPTASVDPAVEAMPTPAPVHAPDPISEPERKLVDMAGRTVMLPAEVRRAVGVDGGGDVFLYTLAPEKMIGWSGVPGVRAGLGMPAEYAMLPTYTVESGWSGQVTENSAQLLIQSGAVDGVAARKADALQKQAGVPVVVLSGKLADTPAAYQFLAAALGGGAVALNARADILSRFAQAALDRVANLEISEDDMVSVYLGAGADSLEPVAAGSSSAEGAELAGGRNIAVFDQGAGFAEGDMFVPLDLLIQWDPSHIFATGSMDQGVSGADAAEYILGNPAFLTISAAKNGRVYGVPCLPFSWLGEPAGPNRIAGLSYMGRLLYPDFYEDIDLVRETRDFYRLFYQTELTDAQAMALLGSAYTGPEEA